VYARLAAISLLGPVLLHAQDAPSRPAPVHLDSVTWRGNAGALQSAVIDGDPSAEGKPYTMLLRLPAGFWIQPHTHNVPKRIMVLRGELLVGHGEAIDTTGAQRLRVGDFLAMPAEHAHYEGGVGETVIALYGLGPLRTTFVNQRR
jgi:quercetin dioxygenase-like cupin family protein